MFIKSITKVKSRYPYVSLKLTYFELFNIPTTYYVNKKDMEVNYTQMQKYIHPDINKNTEDLSSVVNEAYSILKDDCYRAKYLLDIKGEIPNKEIEPITLTHIMELNDKIDEGEDVTEEINTKLETLKEEFNQALEVNELVIAKQVYTKLNYYYNIKKKIS
jgi:molecular chaperone HscB